MPDIFVFSYANVSQECTGFARRVNELLRAIGDKALLVQPGPKHPATRNLLLPTDFGRYKVGINWGIFNFFWPHNRKLAQAAIEQAKPAVVVLTEIWDYHAVGDLRVPLLLDAQNVEAIAIGERFGVNHPFTRIVKAYERKVAHRVKHIFTCSEIDRRAFINLYTVPESHVSVVPNGVEVEPPNTRIEIDRDAEMLLRTLDDHTVLFFMGKLDYQPNAEALGFMSSTLMPALEREAPGRFKLLVCGGPVPRGYFHRSMIFAGPVPSLVPYLRRADVCLAPISTGSGTRLKVLEYLGARKPVIATAKAVEGLDCVSGEHLVIAEVHEFASQIREILGSKTELTRLGCAGFEFVKAHYDWANTRAAWRAAIGAYR